MSVKILDVDATAKADRWIHDAVDKLPDERSWTWKHYPDGSVERYELHFQLNECRRVILYDLPELGDDFLFNSRLLRTMKDMLSEQFRAGLRGLRDGLLDLRDSLREEELEEELRTRHLALATVQA